MNTAYCIIFHSSSLGFWDYFQFILNIHTNSSGPWIYHKKLIWALSF